MRENFKSGSVRGLIATLGLLPQKKVCYGLYSTMFGFFKTDEKLVDKVIEDYDKEIKAERGW